MEIYFRFISFLSAPTVTLAAMFSYYTIGMKPPVTEMVPREGTLQTTVLVLANQLCLSGCTMFTDGSKRFYLQKV